MRGLASGLNSDGRHVHIATLSTLLSSLPHSSVGPQFRGGKQLRTSTIIGLQGQLLIDTGCFVTPVRSRQSLTNEAVHSTT